MLNFETHLFICEGDNFGLLVHDKATGATAAIDAAATRPYLDELEKKGWNLTDILVTHHHSDHVAGIPDLARETGAKVTGNARSRQALSFMDIGVEDGDHIMIGDLRAQALSTPAHTLDSLSWWFEEAGFAHTGDTLFSVGCGRVFEGDAPMLHASLDYLVRTLPPQTRIFCGHEYTASNIKFALSVDPENAELLARAAEVESILAKGGHTLPTTMEKELKTNPFLRTSDVALRRAIGMASASDVEVFTQLRHHKDRF
ncbi:hydroxyacylglutathione hydrolase [Polycladidibacter hongkongensis]|uniref:hydroxyacylglutathione hydrolase n=1 Tax=Polycladidibacter hongkongensis TaxID=1647556 RepID=UPI00082BC9D7|nr:hydroxyacylglutathione hydrolase [Pseudovibrio hongkongensis]